MKIIQLLCAVMCFSVETLWGETAENLYQTYCAQCHGVNKEGGVGPSLVDATWLIPEPSQDNIQKVITDGVPNKGMPAWGRQLSAAQIAQLAQLIAPTEKKAATLVLDDKLDLQKIRLPKNFSISVYAENLVNPRGLVVDEKDRVYVGSRSAGKVYVVEDKNQDLYAEKVTVVADQLNSPIGVTLLNGDLYVAEMTRVIRFANIAQNYEKKPNYQIIKSDFPTETWHGEKIIKAGPDGKLYVPIGAPCNVCVKEEDPHSKIWRMNPDGSQFEIYARGVRNSVGFAWHPQTQEFWFTDNGRDQMGDNLPSCELNYAPKANLHFGFPYCHAGVIPDPEFGKGKRCEDYVPPVALLGPHVAPLGLNFYTGKMFPEDYQHQLFVAEHGSWNRSQKIGYQVSLVTLYGNKLVSQTTFADFLDGDKVLARPVDVAFLSDGSMLVTDDYGGRIFRIAYDAHLSATEKARSLAASVWHKLRAWWQE